MAKLAELHALGVTDLWSYNIGKELEHERIMNVLSTKLYEIISKDQLGFYVDKEKLEQILGEQG